jgi:hypothetical protein
MKTCGYCGRDNEDDAVFCRECGQSEFAAPAETNLPESESHVKQLEPAEAAFESPEPDIGPDSEAAICPFCLFPNLPTRQWCKQCGAPVGSFSNYGAFESALSVGCMWRGAVRNRPRPFVLLGVWGLFFPWFCVALLSLLCALYFLSIPLLVVSLIQAVIPFSLLYQVTRNYVTLPKLTLDE